MTKKSKDHVEKFELCMLDLTFLYRSNILAPMMYFFSIREFSGFLFPNNLYYKISFNISQVNEMWKIHVRYDSNSSLCLIYKKEGRKT